MLKTHHKMNSCDREFQYLLAKIISKIVKYQYLPAKTIHFSLSHLTLSSTSHISLSPLILQVAVLGAGNKNRDARGPMQRAHKSISAQLFIDFLGSGEAALAGDVITAWKPLREGWKLHESFVPHSSSSFS